MNARCLAVEDRAMDALGGEQQAEQPEDRARRADAAAARR